MVVTVVRTGIGTLVNVTNRAALRLAFRPGGAGNSWSRHSVAAFMVVMGSVTAWGLPLTWRREVRMYVGKRHRTGCRRSPVRTLP